MGWQSDAAEVARVADQARSSSTGWWRVNCPLCVIKTGKADRKGCLAIYMASGGYVCWKCGSSGRLPGSKVRDLDDLPVTAPAALMRPPEGFVALASEEGSLSLMLEDAREYAAGRCPQGLWGETGIGACAVGKYAGRVIVPITAKDPDHWLGWVGRTWYDCDRAYTYPVGMQRGDFLYRGWLASEKTDEPLLVVEGVFDAIAVWPNAVACMGQVSGNQTDLLVDAQRPVVVVMDGDAWANGYQISLKLKLHGQRAGYVRLPPKTDPGDVPRAWLDEEVRRAIS